VGNVIREETRLDVEPPPDPIEILKVPISSGHRALAVSVRRGTITHGGSKQPPYAALLSSLLLYVEKVRSQFLSLRQLG
jgi:hypothetical protein